MFWDIARLQFTKSSTFNAMSVSAVIYEKNYIAILRYIAVIWSENTSLVS